MNIKEKEQTIEQLQTEKEQLEQQLLHNSTKVDSKLGKVNEMRRKKIQELELELKERKRALAETSKMLKMKENSSRDMERLKRDILVRRRRARVGIKNTIFWSCLQCTQLHTTDRSCICFEIHVHVVGFEWSMCQQSVSVVFDVLSRDLSRGGLSRDRR